MNLESKSIYRTETKVLPSKLLGSYWIGQDPERAVKETGLSEDEIERITGGRYPPSHKKSGRLKGKVRHTHKGTQIIGGYGDKVLWTKGSMKQE